MLGTPGFCLKTFSFCMPKISYKIYDTPVVHRELVSTCDIGEYGGVVTVSGQKHPSQGVNTPKIVLWVTQFLNIYKYMWLL